VVDGQRGADLGDLGRARAAPNRRDRTFGLGLLALGDQEARAFRNAQQGQKKIAAGMTCIQNIQRQAGRSSQNGAVELPAVWARA
jgi:hypothetical protein